MRVANFVLRSKGEWNADDGDRYNFSVLPAGSFNKLDGIMFLDGKDRWGFGYIWSWAIFRTSSKDVNYYFPGEFTKVVKDNTVDPYAGTSVRCLKDY